MKYFLFALSLVIIAALSLFFWYQSALRPVNSSDEEISFVVSKSESGNSVITRLRSAGLIRSESASRIYLKINGLSNKLKPGGYVLTSTMSASQVFDTLISGPQDIWITFPEGWRREQIAARLANTLVGFDEPLFLQLTAQSEGWLFPDTYLIPFQAAPSDILNIFLKNLAKKTGLDPQSGADREILILASLVEREAKSDPDRGLISGILKKRLANDWPLQVDATVQYAANGADNWWQPITDTKYPSPYNTYLYPGLPPGPICNPGLAAINAVRNPQESPYWYYLTGNDGVTYYAATLDGHNLNIARYLRP